MRHRNLQAMTLIVSHMPLRLIFHGNLPKTNQQLWPLPTHPIFNHDPTYGRLTSHDDDHYSYSQSTYA